MGKHVLNVLIAFILSHISRARRTAHASGPVAQRVLPGIKVAACSVVACCACASVRPRYAADVASLFSLEASSQLNGLSRFFS